MSEYYDDYDISDDIEDIGENIYSEYMPDQFVNQEDVYEQMFKEFNIVDSQIRKEELFKENVIPDDILMKINIDENIDKDNREIEDLIDRGLETRFFQNDPNSFLNSRVGMAEAIGQEQTLGTIIHGYDKLAKRQEAINRIYMNAQELFTINFNKACSKYGIEKKKVDGLMSLLFKSEFFEYKNPFGILFGFLCLRGRNINDTLVNDVYKKYAIQENISMLDLIRYARFIKSLY